jgi:hypothetical protein
LLKQKTIIMNITSELNLTSFNFWSGAKNHYFSYNELKEIESQLEEVFYEEAPTETQINDLFWFEEETLCDWIGIDYDEYLNRDQ